MNTKISIGCDKRNKKKPWVVRWSGERDIDTGKSKRYAHSFKLKVKAEAFASQKAVDFDRGGRRDEPKETLKPFCDKWVRLNNSHRPETLKLYGYTIDRLLNYFGPDCLLRKIATDRAELFIAELKPLKNIEELSDWTKHRTLRHCKTIFQSAVRWGNISQNPFKHIKGPKLRTTPWHYVKPDEYMQLLDAAPNTHRKAFYALCYTGGLRFSEAVSLRWSDINFLSGEVTLRNRRGTDTEPEFLLKDYEERTIQLPPATLNILEATEAASPYVVLDKAQYANTIIRWRKNRRSWRWQDALYNAGRDFGRHLRKASIEAEPGETLSIHTLRKSCIQNWANKLPMNVVKELAGHSNIATTQKFYTKVDPYYRAKAAEVTQDALNRTDVKLTYGDV